MRYAVRHLTLLSEITSLIHHLSATGLAEVPTSAKHILQAPACFIFQKKRVVQAAVKEHK
jgi:hypothetical protein